MMRPATAEDPFIAVQKEVESNWQSILVDFEQWRIQTTLHSTHSNTTAHQQLENKLHTIQWDIQDLTEAMRNAKQDPAKFNLQPGQIDARERFLSNMNSNIQSIQAALNSAATKGDDGDVRITRAGNRDELFDSVGDGGAMDDKRREAREANDAFINDQMQQQEFIMQQQDEDLDHLASAVERIGLMGHDMHQELAEQGQLLDDLGDEMDHAQTRMANVRQKLDKFIEETGPKQFCTIVGLSITFLVLTFLVATT